ncbi:nose resistant to fluoxetine protein 6-like [Culicoides brevitarsis]|uniref:nose resistant to fluoxetine protein 6-like n=1 Tax=Culicoides brevitarsis TaxID=469753 RepID=UPI00307B97A5
MTEYYQLPPLYVYHDFDKCMALSPPSDDAKYCIVETVIQPNLSSSVWNLIVKYNDTKRHFRHDKIQHGLCRDTCTKLLEQYARWYQEDNLYLNDFRDGSAHIIDADTFNNGLHDRFDNDRWVNYCTNEMLRQKYDGLKGRSSVVYCIRDDEKWKIDIWDYLFYSILILITILTIFGSFYDIYRSRDHPESQFLVAFSIGRNIRRLVKSEPPIRGSLEDDLQFLYAIRFLTMFCVVGGHVLLFNEIFPISNSEYIEKYHEILTMMLANGFKVIETYLIISGLLMSLNYFKFIKDSPFGLKHFLQAIVYRYLRLIPMVIFIIFLNATVLIHLQNGPLWKMIGETERSFCRNNWWSNVLFINNYIHVQDPCIQQSWFLATDFQLTIFGMFLMILTTKYQKYVKQIFGVAIFASFVIPAVVVYRNGFEGIMMVTPEEMKYVMIYDKTYQKFYLPSHMNIGPYLYGMITGVLLHNIRLFKVKITQSRLLTGIWYLVVPIAVGTLLSGFIFYENNFEKPSLWIAIYASVSKNSWGLLGIIFILGLVSGASKLVKNFLDHPVFKPLGKITFSVFLCHTFIIRVTLGDIRAGRHLSDMHLLGNVCSTFFLSYLLGFLLHVLIEAPFLVILKSFFKVEKKSEQKLKNPSIELFNS